MQKFIPYRVCRLRDRNVCNYCWENIKETTSRRMNYIVSNWLRKSDNKMNWTMKRMSANPITNLTTGELKNCCNLQFNKPRSSKILIIVTGTNLRNGEWLLLKTTICSALLRQKRGRHRQSYQSSKNTSNAWHQSEHSEPVCNRYRPIHPGSECTCRHAELFIL